jgi:ATP-dependent protease HslVU (ClpYQ) peptidase subunit
VFAFFLRFWKQLSRRYSLVNEQPHQDDPSPFADLDSSFLVVSSGGIFYVSGNLSVSQFDRYYAVGSGSSYALGALHVLFAEDLDADEIARRACAAAMTFDLYCGGEMEVRPVAGRRAPAKRTARRDARR